MVRSNGLGVWLGRQSVRWRWLVALVAGAAATGFELVEHHIRSTADLDATVLGEVAIFGLVVPLVVGIILSALAPARREPGRAAHPVDAQARLSEDGRDPPAAADLVNRIVQLPRALVPGADVSLLLRDPGSGRFVTILEPAGGAGAVAEQPPLRSQSHDPCPPCVLAWPAEFGKVTPCRCQEHDGARETASGSRYCLPLANGEAPVGLLRLSLPCGASLTAERLAILNGAAPSMVLAIEAVRLQRATVTNTAAVAELRRVARDLHDSVAQNLCYLRLKLDQIASADMPATMLDLQNLARLRDIANEAYEQVRGMLLALPSRAPGDLERALKEFAGLLSQRSNLVVELVSEGEVRPLPSDLQQQVYFIVREALTNVEKHAGAHRIRVRLIWGEDALSVVVADDGRGFEPQATLREGHFGLAIMRARADEIRARLTLTSKPGAGTTVSLCLPLDSTSAS